MSNERVSQLTEITATEIASDDLFLVSDMSAVESKKMTTTQLGLYLNISGSTYVPHAVLADTASSIAGANVVGTVASASLAASVITASYARTASLVTSASHAVLADSVSGGITNSITSSYLNYVAGANTGTASFALTASLVVNSTSASFLIYTGANNGTASNAISASSVISSSVSISSSFAISASRAATAGTAGTATSALTASYLLVGLGPTVDSASHALIADVAYVASSSLASDAAYSSSWATNAITASYTHLANSVRSASFASSSISASYATSASYEIVYETSSSYSETASYAIFATSSWNPIKAWAQLSGSDVVSATGSQGAISYGFNISDVSSSVPTTFNAIQNVIPFYIKFSAPLPSTNYMIIGSGICGSDGGSSGSLVATSNFDQVRKTTECTMSVKGDCSLTGAFYLTFTIYG